MEQKRNRMTTSEHCLDMFKRNSKEFLRRFVTVDETWIHDYTVEMKEPSKQWTSPDERASKKSKTVPSVGKVMTTVFWDSPGIIFTDYLENGRTITEQYYADLLSRFEAELMKRRPHLAKKKLLFHRDNAPAHSSAIDTANWSNFAMNCCLIHPILQIWSHAIYFCSQT